MSWLLKVDELQCGIVYYCMMADLTCKSGEALEEVAICREYENVGLERKIDLWKRYDARSIVNGKNNVMYIKGNSIVWLEC